MLVGLLLALALRSASGQIIGGVSTSCNYDRNCFTCSPNVALARARPFERRTPSTCEDCLNLCLTFQSSGLYSCQTAVYDKAYRSCDLFAVQRSGQTPAVQYACRDMCVPTGRCSGTSTTTAPIPSAAQCPPGEVAKFLSIKDNALSATPTQVIPGLSRDQCVQTCSNNRDQSGNSVPCRAVVFNNGQCEIYMDVARPTGTGTLTPRIGSEYLEKVCFPESAVRGCGDIIERWPGYRLVGFALDVTTTGSYDECMRECLATPNCASGMYFAEDNVDNCILNSATKDTNPDLFGPDPDRGSVEYFQPDCPGRGRLRDVSKRWREILTAGEIKDKRRQFQDVVLRDTSARRKLMEDAGSWLGEWSHWSNCELATNTQVRYKMCDKVDIRECENEVQTCPKEGEILREDPSAADDHPLALNKCICLYNGQGKEVCEDGVGIRRVRVGSRYKMEYCKDPQHN